MISVERLRHRLPLPVFAVLLIFAVVVLGLVCLCSSDHPGQAVERAIAALGSAPGIIEMWPLLLLSLGVFVFVLPRRVIPVGRASPAALQRFLH